MSEKRIKERSKSEGVTKLMLKSVRVEEYFYDLNYESYYFNSIISIYNVPPANFRCTPVVKFDLCCSVFSLYN